MPDSSRLIRERSDRIVDSIDDSYIQNQYNEEVDEYEETTRRRRHRSLSPPRRPRRTEPYKPPSWKQYYYPQADDKEVAHL